MRYCRFCGKKELHEFVDLEHQPPSNSFLTEEQLDQPEVYYPLKLFVCSSCFLVQVGEALPPETIFKDDYVYYSSQSPSNVSHAKELVDMVMERFKPHYILEIGSNDGYLLRHFPPLPSTSCLGLEPAIGPAMVAQRNGINTITEFFNTETAKWLREPSYAKGCDLIIGVNVLAHQPDINDFVAGLEIALAPDGVIIMEFPHLMKLVEGLQFDTIYHEHYSYFSFVTVCEIFRRHGLGVFDVDEIPEHGGSLRIYVKHYSSNMAVSESVCFLGKKEDDAGMNSIDYYAGFQSQVEQIRRDFLQFLYGIPADQLIMAYGAAAKGNTFLNYCGVKSDMIPIVVDRSPYKQNKHLPGSHIRVTNEEELKQLQPDYVLILPWNLKEEIMEQLKYIRDWGGKFVVAIPGLEII